MVFADVLCLRRRRGGWRIAPERKEQAQPSNRGCGKMPLPVTEDTPPDMLAGAMDIKVLLPSGRTVNMSVERSTPMMDLLVQLTTVHKLSLAGHTTVALSDSGYPLHHLPSTPLGALDTRIIHVAQRTNTLKRAPLRPNNVQPFTTTFRLQVHLPRNQLFVTRVSPDTRLSDILRLACSEKNLDPNKYELRHPANLCECLSLSHTLADYRLQEVTLVASRAPGAPLTPADIMALQREEEKRRQQVKKTGGIYSIIFNKRSKGIPEGSGSVSSDSLNGRSISPARSDESIERSVSPPAPAPPQRPGRKRRPAPKPPAPAPTPTPTNLQNNNGETGVDSGKDGSTTLSHSRTSSDSSGYHEASVLSESPDTRTNSSADTLPRRSKLPSTNHIVAKNKSSTLQHGTSNVGNNNLSRSLSNLTAVGINTQNMHSASTSSLASQGLMPRKKKAAPPPPSAPVKIPHSNSNTKNDASKPTEVVAALLHDIKTFDQNRSTLNRDNPNADERLANLDKHIFKPIQTIPKLDDILNEEDIVLDVTTTKRASVHTLKNVEQTSMEYETFVSEEPRPSLNSASSRVEHLATPIISPDLVTSAIVHAPPPAAQDDQGERIPPTEELVLRDNITPTPGLEELPDWQYHLPAPPSAFRDLHSPTTTEFETVVLADANVFQEVLVDDQSKHQNKYKPVQKFDHMVNSSTNETQKGLTQSDCVSNSATSITSLQNCHSSLSPQISIDNSEKYVIEKEAIELSKTTVNSDSDWEPQTITVAENISRTKPKFNNGDLRLRQDGVTKEVYKVNPIFNNQHFEDDVKNKETSTPTEIKSEENAIYKYNHSSNRNSNTDLQLSSQLKNFTISTYNKPQSIDSIFSDNHTNETDTIFKKPFAPLNTLPITRTNSYSMMDKDRPVPSVKRSTSYVSLARPYAKPSTFQSISRTKSISNLVWEEESSLCLRKSTSDANLNQAEDVPLQSLQVLKAILPHLSQSQILYEHSPGTHPPQTLSQTIDQDTTINTEMDSKISQLAAITQENASETVPYTAEETKSAEVPKSEAPRPFVYRGPPAVNFSTWSERPKVQVSLKSDRDYRMGKQSTITNVNSSQVHTQQPTKETTIINRNSHINNSSSVRNLVKEATQSKLTVVNSTDERLSKIEPTPLTMRIVSHTPSNYRNNTSLVGNAEQSSQVVKQDKTELQTERLPIVRAVELKKTHPESCVLLRNMSTTHLNGSSSNNVANVPVSYHQSTLYDRHSYVEPTYEKVTGSVLTNAVTKSISTSQINIEEPENSSHQSKHVSEGGKKYTSVIGINGSGAGSAKVIQHSASVKTMHPAIQLPRSQSVRQNFSTVKVNSFSGPKPMPIVKGFRFAGTEAANYDRGPVKISIEPERTQNHSIAHGSKSGATNGAHFDSKATKQPLKTINGIENLKTKSNTSHTFGCKVQKSTSITDDVDGRSGTSNIPDPPKVPNPPAMVIKKPSQRPVPRFTNPRDELMDAIKHFGGRESLKPSKPKPNSNVVLTI